MTPTMLVVDDDLGFCTAADHCARVHKFETRTASSLSQARSLVLGTRFNLILLDLSLPDGSGFELLDDGLRADHIAIVTGSPSVATATRAVGSPIQDYLIKPLAGEQLDALLRRVASSVGSQSEQLDSADHCGELIGRSRPMRQVFGEIRRVAATELTVFLTGESGTGKELAARAVHEESGRSGPFVALNCGAVAPELLASELFGHERGSFTGAHRQHAGCFERAHQGTVFLDEITEMPLSLQAHLLRVLETRTITRVGGQSEVPLDIRVVAASNRDPHQAVKSGQLREDLLYRLVDFPIALPPLREREDDAVFLAHVFLNRLNRKQGSRMSFAAGTDALIRSHDWPGNVRELMHCVRRGFLLADKGLVHVDPPPRRRSGPIHEDARSLTFAVGTPFERMQRAMLLKTLAYFNNDKTRTAKSLGVSVKTVYNHLARIPAGSTRDADK